MLLLIVRNKLLPLLLALTWQGSACAADLEGTWFSCNPELETPSPWKVLTIEREGKLLKWQTEWGQNYSSSGTVSVRGKELVFTGCYAYRGEIDSKCNEANPPITMTQERAEFTRKHKSLTFALASDSWIRVGQLSLHDLAERCEKLRDHTLSKRISSKSIK